MLTLMMMLIYLFEYIRHWTKIDLEDMSILSFIWIFEVIDITLIFLIIK